MQQYKLSMEVADVDLPDNCTRHILSLGGKPDCIQEILCSNSSGRPRKDSKRAKESAEESPHDMKVYKIIHVV